MSLFPLLLEMSLVEQESVLNSIRALIENEGWELDDDVTPEEMLSIVQEVLDSGDLTPEGKVRLEGFGKALHKAVSRGARIAGKVARGVDKVRGAASAVRKRMRMRQAKFRSGVKRIKHAAKSNFQAGRSGAPSARKGPRKKLSAAQVRQRSKAAQASGKRRKGKKVKRRMLPPRK